MKIGEILFVIWTVLIAIWWIATEPESAPQQAALAGQALVLVTLPYCILAALQRRYMRGGQVLTTETSLPVPSQEAAEVQDIDPELLTRPDGISKMQSRVRGEKGDEGAIV